MSLLSLPHYFIGATFMLGLVVGSFLNVVILRLPVMLERKWRRQASEHLNPNPPPATPEPTFNLILPASRCGGCGHAIRPWENVPILSFLFLRGKCSACRKTISWRYPLVELFTAVLSAAIAWRFGYGYAAGAALLFTWTLVALTFIDYDTQLLPDDITLPLLWAGLLINVFHVFAPLSSAVIGAIAGYATLWLVFHGYKLATGKEGMGYGDFKLLAALGAWLGWEQLLVIILMSSIIGAVVGITLIVCFGRDRNVHIPFGPFLCGAGWVALMWGDTILHGYLKLMRV